LLLAQSPKYVQENRILKSVMEFLPQFVICKFLSARA